MILMDEKVVLQSSFCLVSRLPFEMNLANLTVAYIVSMQFK